MTRSNPTRRSFLQSSALAGAAAISVPATAKAATPRARGGNGPGGNGKVCVVLFQRGGSDFLNLYAPVGDPNYAVKRPTIGLLPPGSPSGTVGLAMSPIFAMHPNMAGIHAAFTAPNSRCAVVHAVGYQPPNRSHFVSQDLYETGMMLNTTGDGWINRHLQVTSSPTNAPVRALALSGALPRALYGAYPCYNVASTQDLVFAGSAAERQLLEAVVENTVTTGMPTTLRNAYQGGVDAFGLIDLFAPLSPTTYAPANGAVYPTSTLGKGLKEIAEVIKAGLGIEFFTVDQGGWDHHHSLVNNIAPLATDLNNSITAFFQDLGALASEVVLVAMSEFGREVQQNGSNGTDHGVGGAMLVMGGQVQGGAVRGVWPTLANNALDSGRFLAASNDFRDVLREVLMNHMGGTDPNVVFPGRVYQPLGVV